MNNMSWKEEDLVELKNLRMVRDDSMALVDNGGLMLRSGRLVDSEKVFFDEQRRPDVIIDCGGLVAAPGFIDLQINGAYNHDFTAEYERVAEAIEHVSKNLVRHGCTAYCPTLITSPPHVYREFLVRFLDAMKENNRLHDRARVLGAHFEGPFISKEKKGAHDIELIKPLKSEEKSDPLKTLEEVYGGLELPELSRRVRIITMAPELDPECTVVKSLTSQGIVVSLGHSESNLSQGSRAVFEGGARLITHLFNAMLPFHHRDPHLVGLLSERCVPPGQVYYGIIADSIHTHPSALAIAYRARPTGLCLVTDAISPMGLARLGSTHPVGNRVAQIVRDPQRNVNMAVLQGTNTLCGSIATIDECIRGLMSATGCSLVEAVKCASEHPARVLGLFPEMGSLRPGSLADFALLDPVDCSVRATFVGGNLVWHDENFSFTIIKSR